MSNATEQKNRFQQPGRVKVIKGTIINPEYAGLRLILSVNNLKGDPAGNPLLPVFDKKWPKVRAESRGLYATKTGSYKLGNVVGSTPVQSDIWVMHMLVQDEDLNVDVAALEKCLKDVCKTAKYERATVACSSLLVDAIPELTELVNKCLVEEGVSVNYYEESHA